VPAADREPLLRHSAAVRRAVAGLLVALLLAALTPLLSAGPAGAARVSARVLSAPATTATPSTSAGQPSRGGVRQVGHRSPDTVGRRVTEKTAALRQGHPQRGGSGHKPTGPASGSIDATGPPSSYPESTVSSTQQRLGDCDYPAAAGRAPPSSCGS
jgi:hypothetical protein